MSEEKQIEEIKKVLIHTCKRIRSLEDDIMQDHYAKALYNAGYRKQSEGEWVKPSMYSEDICSNCGRSPKLFFGLLSPYCPNCGAKMKGGAE